jgi:hypothetical protein
MAAVLTINADATNVRRTLGGIEKAAQKAAAGIQAAFRGVDTAMIEGAARAAREVAQSLALVAREHSKVARAGERAERRASTIAAHEGNYRTNARRREGTDAIKTAEQVARARELAEKRATQASVREAGRRSAIDRQRAREERQLGQQRAATAARIGRVVGGTASAGAQFAGAAHGQIQGARGQAAMRESLLNDALIQTIPQGNTAGEIARSRGRVSEFTRMHRLDPDAVIAALGEAQSFSNALGGASEAERGRNLESTLSDVDFASQIDPRNMNSLVQFGAMFRGRVDEPTRRSMMRSAVGISFQGSVETEQALKGGRAGLLQSIASATATAPQSEHAAITAGITRDYLAQIQTVAASGGTVGVTAGRITTLRSALNNPHTQNRLGRALARREMTADQRTEFDSVFHRGDDGKYTMGADVVNSPSRAAALLGHMFGDDPTAVRTFLGAHGGGGAQQLINRPEAGLLTSYFAMGQDAQGRQVRQYDAVGGLAGATVTAANEATIREVREAEDAKRLQADENQHAATLGNTSALTLLSNQLASFVAGNPLLTSALTAGAGLVGGSGLLGRAAGAVPGLARGVVGAVTGGEGLAGLASTAGRVAALGSVARVAVAGVGGALVGEGMNRGINALAAHNGGRSDAQAFGEGNAPMIGPAAISEIARAIRDGLMGAPITLSVNPVAAAQGRSAAASGGNAPPPESR